MESQLLPTFDEYIQACHLLHHEDLVMLKSLDGMIKYISPPLNHILQSTCHLGDFVHELDCFCANFQAQDQLVVQTKASHQFLDIYKTNSGYQVFTAKKQPILAGDEVVGILVFCQPQLLNLDKLQLVYHMNPTVAHRMEVKREKGKLRKVELTKRESEILFLLMYGKTCAEIANLLSAVENKVVAESTIKNTINRQLKIKFRAFSIDSLVKSAIKLGYDEFIPETFMRSSSLHLCESNHEE